MQGHLNLNPNLNLGRVLLPREGAVRHDRVGGSLTNYIEHVALIHRDKEICPSEGHGRSFV